MSGAAGALGWTLARTLRFRRRLTLATEVAPPEVQRLADEIGAALGLRRVPTIHTARADISPMVWWAFGPVRVLIPSTLLAALSTDELRCVLAHELAHARRRDHVARWHPGAHDGRTPVSGWTGRMLCRTPGPGGRESRFLRHMERGEHPRVPVGRVEVPALSPVARTSSSG
ncbi:M56 family metallopeptidase [Candidatus Palauibacter sp.]|uniref:M56 family metallopeptidase n=1 Tax=Candidatus Palauibacter sp. TaxID=3101350 RepID=UPI003B02330E